MFLDSSKAASIEEIIFRKGNSRTNIIQNLYTFQAWINEVQTTPRICLQEHTTLSNEKNPRGKKRLDQIKRDPFIKKNGGSEFLKVPQTHKQTGYTQLYQLS